MVKIGEITAWLSHYPNIEALVERTDTPAHNVRNQARYSDGVKWAGGTFRQAQDIARSGWDTARFEMETSKVKGHTGEYTTVPHYDVHGAVVDMGAFLSGVPENMIDFPVVENHKFIDIIFDLSTPAVMEVDHMLNRGNALACLIDHFENTGYRVNLSAFVANKLFNPDQWFVVKIDLKEYDQPLNLSSLSATVHPSFFRQLCLAALESISSRLNMPPDYLNENLYGYAVSSKSAMRQIMKTVINASPGSLVIPGILYCIDVLGWQGDEFKTIDSSKAAIQKLVDNPIL